MKKFLCTLLLFLFFGQAQAAQHDYNLENQPGAAFRADLNDLASALQSANSGPTEPANKAAGLIWYDTASGWLKRWDGAAWIPHSKVSEGVPQFIGIAASDQSTAITTGAAKATFIIPIKFKVLSVVASLKTASTSGAPIIDINEAGATILSTKITIDQDEKNSSTAATPAVISDDSIAAFAEITIDIDGAGADAVGLIVYLIGYADA